MAAVATTTKVSKKAVGTKTKAPITTHTEQPKEAPTAEQSVPVNGSYEFLVNQFKEPVTIIDAATALAAHSHIDAHIATKKVEAFIENAKIDRALEVRAGTGNNEGQFIIARVPQSAQRKNGGTKVKKDTKKKDEQKTTKGEGVIATMVRLLQKEHTKDQVIAALVKHFPDRQAKAMASTFNIQVAGNHPRLAEKGVKIQKRKVEDKIFYQITA
jgi:hypothetical protein